MDYSASLMIYIPGISGKMNAALDYVLTKNLDLPNLHRHFLEILHLCIEGKESISRAKPLAK